MKEDGRRNNGRTTYRRWALEERVRLKKLMDLKLPLVALMKELNRNSSTIHRELRRGGGKDDYDPEAAQAYADTEHERRSNAAKKNPPPPLFSKWINDKIDSLSMQIDVLIDVIRNKKPKQ